MDHIAVLADSETLLGFRLAGIRNAMLAGSDADASLAKALDAQGIGILVVTQDVVNRASAKARKRLEASTKPVIVVIPGKGQKAAAGSQSLALLVKKAMGVDLFKEDAPNQKLKR